MDEQETFGMVREPQDTVVIAAVAKAIEIQFSACRPVVFKAELDEIAQSIGWEL